MGQAINQQKDSQPGEDGFLCQAHFKSPKLFVMIRVAKNSSAKKITELAASVTEYKEPETTAEYQKKVLKKSSKSPQKPQKVKTAYSGGFICKQVSVHPF